MTPEVPRADHSGDRESDLADFSAFYDEHGERVLVFLVRRCLDAEVAVDLMAESFAQAFASRRRFPGRTAAEAGAWLLALARHQLHAYFDRGRVEQKAIRSLGIEVPPVDREDAARIEDLAALRELRGVAGERLERLPVDERSALRLRVIEELPYPDVARMLAVSEQTARARVSLGLRRLSRLPAKRYRTQAMADSQQRSAGEPEVLLSLGREFERAVEEQAATSRGSPVGLGRPDARAMAMALTAVVLAGAGVGVATGWLPIGAVVPAGR